MSASASWSYTSTATLWVRYERDDWTGKAGYSEPELFACDYSAESIRMTDARGVEFTTRQIIHTERAGIKAGDMILIGEEGRGWFDPVAAGAFEVRAVNRFADTFDQVADDFKVVT
jgi:hypothetical protein